MSTELPVWAETVRARLTRLSGRELPAELATSRSHKPDSVPRMTGSASHAPEATAFSAPDPTVDDNRIQRWRMDPGQRGIKVFACLVVIVALIAGGVALWMRPHPTAVTVKPVGATQEKSTQAESALVIAVSGTVLRPGLVRVPRGARVADVIEAAGGLAPDADVGHLNLARKVADGELVVIGVPEPGAAPPGSAFAPGKVNLNSATVAELDALPGVGPVTAQRIVDYRTSHGPFQDVGDLRRIEGIGDAKFERLKELVIV